MNFAVPINIQSNRQDQQESNANLDLFTKATMERPQSTKKLLVLVFDQEKQQYKLVDPMFESLHTELVENEFIDDVLAKISRCSHFKYTSNYGYWGVYSIGAIIILFVLLLSILIILHENSSLLKVLVPFAMFVICGLGILVIWMIKQANKKIARYLDVREN